MKSRHYLEDLVNPKVEWTIGKFNRYGFHFTLKFTVRRNVIKFLMWPLRAD